MKVGIIKEIDRLGRIVIPKELGNRFCLTELVEVVATDEGVLLRSPKYKLVPIEKNERPQHTVAKDPDII